MARPTSMARAFLAGLILALSAILVALLAAVAYEFSQTGLVSAAKVSLVGATLACLFVLVGILLTQPGPGSHAPHCQNCGMRMYATLRSLDRREVLTCFGCGAEWVMPSIAPRERPPVPEGAKPIPPD